MAVPRVAEELERQKGAHGVGCRDLPGTWEVRFLQDVLERNFGQERQKEKESSEFGAKHAGLEIKALDPGGISRNRARRIGPFVIPAPREFGEAFCREEGRDRGGAESMALLPENIPNITDGEILLAQSDDALPEWIGLGSGVGTSLRREEKLRVRILPEVMHEDSEAARSVAEALRDLGGWDLLDEEGAKSLILALSGAGGFEEKSVRVCYLIFWNYIHIPTISKITPCVNGENWLAANYMKSLNKYDLSDGLWSYIQKKYTI
jgi:hypothetical protein